MLHTQTKQAGYVTHPN